MKTVTIRLLLLLVIGVAAIAQTGHVPELRCELRESEDGDRNHGSAWWFSPKQHTHLNFIVASNRDGLKIYEDWNSWGYYARSFSAKDEQSKTYEITRKQSGWDKNFPSYKTLNKGDFVITDVFLCDGTWGVSPKLPAGHPLTFSSELGPMLKLKLTGRFTMQADKHPGFLEPVDIWTGQIESAPLEVYLDKPCVDALNSERGNSYWDHGPEGEGTKR